MYWIFLILFILAVLTPDIIRSNVFFLSETRAEEIMIFLMGALAFIVFIKKEQQLIFHKKEKEKDKKRIEQTVKDLVESYSYIGEVNRKIDILMGIALGLSDQTVISKKHEKETYASIVAATNSLLKAESTILRFVEMKNSKTKKEFCSNEKKAEIVKNSELTKIGDNINIKKYSTCLVVSSAQEVRGVKSYLIICGYDREEENSPKNLEILKVFASQALFLYSFAHNKETIEKNCPDKA
jgi:hypothetical protein